MVADGSKEEYDKVISARLALVAKVKWYGTQARTLVQYQLTSELKTLLLEMVWHRTPCKALPRHPIVQSGVEVTVIDMNMQCRIKRQLRKPNFACMLVETASTAQRRCADRKEEYPTESQLLSLVQRRQYFERAS